MIMGDKLEINHKSENYWSTVFHNDTDNWNLFKRSFIEAGYIFVKRRDENEESSILSSWLDECLNQWLDLRMLKQLKLLVAFLKRFPILDNEHKSQNSFTSGNITSHFQLGRVLASRITQKFIENKQHIASCLRSLIQASSCDISSQNVNIINKTYEHRILKAFCIWFSIPLSIKFISDLPKDLNIKLADFLTVMRHKYPNIPAASFLWLYNILNSEK